MKKTKSEIGDIAQKIEQKMKIVEKRAEKELKKPKKEEDEKAKTEEEEKKRLAEEKRLELLKKKREEIELRISKLKEEEEREKNEKKKKKKKKKRNRNKLDESSSSSSSSESSSDSEEEEEKKKDNDEIDTDEENKRRKMKKKIKRKIKKKNQNEEEGEEIHLNPKEEEMLPESTVIERKVTREETPSEKPKIQEIAKKKGNEIIIKNLGSEVESAEEEEISEESGHQNKHTLNEEPEDLERIDIQRLEREIEETKKLNSMNNFGKSALSEMRKKKLNNNKFLKASIKFSMLGKEDKKKSVIPTNPKTTKAIEKRNNNIGRTKNNLGDSGWEFEEKKPQKNTRNFAQGKKEKWVEEENGFGKESGGWDDADIFEKKVGLSEKKNKKDQSGIGEKYNGESVKAVKKNLGVGDLDDDDNSWDD